MRQLSNPRSKEDYLKILSPYFKVFKRFEQMWNEHIVYIRVMDNAIADDEYGDRRDEIVERFIKIVTKSIISMYEEESNIQMHEYLGHFVGEALHFEKNDRIEAILKFRRASMAGDLIIAINDFNKYSKRLTEEASDTLAFLFNKFYDDTKVLITPLQQIIAHYNKSTVGDPYEENKKITSPYFLADDFNFHNLKHFLDLYKSNKDRFRAINDFTWAGKSLHNVVLGLTNIEQDINAKFKVSSQAYLRALEEATDSIEFMKLSDGYTWTMILDNHCDFEALIAGGHCGADSSADYLFSLRSKLPNGDLDAHVTVSVKKWDVPEESAYYDKIKMIFQVLQAKGKGNNQPKPEYWPMIMELFKTVAFGWQTDAAWKPESDFKPNWLQNSTLDPRFPKMYSDFIKLKPYWFEPLAAISHYQLLDKDIKEYFVEHFSKSATVSMDDSSVTVSYNTFWEMLEEIKEWCTEFGDAAKDIDEPVDLHYTPDPDYDSFVGMIKLSYKKIYKRLEDISNEHETKLIWLFTRDYKGYADLNDDDRNFLSKLDEAMSQACYRAEESGTSTEKYNAYLKLFDGVELKNSDGEMYAIIDKSVIKKKEQWTIIFNGKELLEYYNQQEEIGFYYPHFDGGRGRHSSFSVEYNSGYDAEYAKEAFSEAMYEQGFLTAKQERALKKKAK